jgi:hypothetical protein
MHKQIRIDNIRNSSGPAVSQLENRSMQVHSIGGRHASHEIWLNSIGRFSHYVQITHEERTV